MREGVDLVVRHGRLDLFHSRFERNADPRVWNLDIEFVWKEPMHHTPCLARKRYNLFCCP
jgi:hypothetical protein